jgi:hypothetical protein
MICVPMRKDKAINLVKSMLYALHTKFGRRINLNVVAPHFDMN